MKYPNYDIQKYIQKDKFYEMNFKNRISHENPINFNFM